MGQLFAAHENIMIEWLFGYGSVIFRPSFPFVERRAAKVDGWSRRFWQLSEDHRGVPGAPGRVVTLVPVAGAVCVGVAFRIDRACADTIVRELDAREQGGYMRRVFEVTVDDGRAVNALAWIAVTDDRLYAPHASLDDLAQQIAHAAGPSGTNREYLEKLADSLRALGATNEDDAHVFELDARVRAITECALP